MEMTGEGARTTMMMNEEAATTQALQGTTAFDSKPATWARSKTKAAYRQMLKSQKMREKGQTSGVLNLSLAGEHGCLTLTHA